jgi:hypothetical protein
VERRRRSGRKRQRSGIKNSDKGCGGSAASETAVGSAERCVRGHACIRASPLPSVDHALLPRASCLLPPASCLLPPASCLLPCCLLLARRESTAA